MVTYNFDGAEFISTIKITLYMSFCDEFLITNKDVLWYLLGPCVSTDKGIFPVYV